MKAWIVGLASWIVLSLSLPASGDDWPGMRGADASGSAHPQGILSRGEPVGLKLRWRIPLGSGYSCVAVSDGRAVTMYADGDMDVMACFDVNDGKKLWSVPLEERYVGHDGSFDGPISTPFIHQGIVFGLSANGKLLAVSLNQGAELWSVQLAEQHKAAAPFYGFSASPIVVAGTLVVQAGAPDALLLGLEPKTGSLIWSAAADTAAHQSPSVINLHGEPVIVASGNQKLFGVDPSAGSVLFEAEHQGTGEQGATTMIPVPAGNGRIFLTHDDRRSKLVAVDRQADQFSLATVWQTASVRGTYSVPAMHDGWIFAYSSRFLTCVDPGNGAAMWRSRTPGDGWLIAVDGHLIISTKNGGVHIARAASNGYGEIAGMQVFKDLCWSFPSFSSDAIYLRSLGELARIDIVPAGDATAAVPAKEPFRTGARFGEMVRRVEAAGREDKPGLVDQYLSEHKDRPIIEDGIVHFVYLSPANDVAIGSDLFGSRQDRAMHHLEGTELFYYTAELPADQRASYVFFVDFQPRTDPENSNTITSSVYTGSMELAMGTPGEIPLKMSWFAMPQWKAPDYLQQLDAPLLGKMVGQTVTAHAMDGEQIPIQVYLPPSYDDQPDRRYPVVYVHEGLGAGLKGRFVQAADKLIHGGEIPPVIVVLVNRKFDFATAFETYPDFVAKDLVPLVDGQFRTQAQRDGRINYGAGFGGYLAALTGSLHMDVFGKLGCQSPLLFGTFQQQVLAGIGQSELPLKCYIEWGRFDLFNPHENWDVRLGCEQAMRALRDSGREVSGGMVNDSTDWSSWQNRYDKVLGALLD